MDTYIKGEKINGGFIVNVSFCRLFPQEGEKLI